MSISSRYWILIFCTVVWANEEELENRVRCIARCLDYIENATMADKTYTCDTSICMECIQACSYEPTMGSSCEQAQCNDDMMPTLSTSSKESSYCVQSCNFLANLSSSTSEPSLAPNKPRKPKVNVESNKLTWDKSTYGFYDNPDNAHMGVVFLLFGSPYNGSSYQWVFIAHTTYRSVDLSLIQNKMFINDQESYVFKVAAFNEWGNKGYKTSDVYKGEELIDQCFPLLPVKGSQPPAYCRQHSPNRTHINLHLTNDQEKLEFSWNNDCSNELASADVVLMDNTLGTMPMLGKEFCYEVYVTVGQSSIDDPSVCYKSEGVYYVYSNKTSVKLRCLLPSCHFFVSAYAGTLDSSEHPEPNLEKELTLKIPASSPACDDIYKHINATVHYDGFDQKSEKYQYRVTWVNPPKSVDYYQISVTTTEESTAISDIIDANETDDFVYTHEGDLTPSACLTKVQIQPVIDKMGRYISTIDSIFCTPALTPSQPEVDKVSISWDSFTISWKAPDEVHSHYPITGYMIELRNTSDESYICQDIVSPNVTMYTISKLLPNHEYKVNVIALTKAGNSSFEDWYTVQTHGEPNKKNDDGSDDTSVGLIIGLVVGIVMLIAVVTVIIVFFAILREKQKYQHHLNQLELDTFRPPVLPPAPFNVDEEPDEWEIEADNLNLLEVLGEGFFGIVLKAEVYHYGPPATSDNVRPLGTLCGSEAKGKMDKTVVACKMLKEISTQDDQEDLLKEIKLMKKIGQHEHIVSILGCITRKHPVCLVVEYCKHGDLLEYLRNSRPAWLLAKKQGSKQVPNRYSAVPGTLKETEGYMPMANNSSPSTPEKPEKPPLEPDDGVVGYEKPVVLSLSSYDLLLFAKQIAQGMDYLFQKDLVHRDLACRNVLVAERNLLKISDFGLTRAIYKDAAYTQKTRGRLPLKWMSVESITDRVFTTQSDVWSFGVVLWEICTLGGFPYPTISNEDMLRKLREGYRMHRPENCSEELYSIMLRCWHPEPNRRPSFSVLVTIIDQMMDTQRANLYVDLNFDAHNQYWMSISELGDSDSDAEPEGSFQESQLQQISFGKDKASYTPYSSEMEHTLVQSGQLNGDIVAADDRENEKLNGHVPTEVHNYTSTTSV